ncbi:MAG: DUF2157 domain-containing protein [Chitinophagaceae bacterium]|nr:DUF2157 domain-containing protein [Chitinophagaceae bacterium]
MNLPLFEQLHAGGHVSDASLQKIKAVQSNKLFSVHWEFKAMLYLGVLLLSGGLSILVYKNIDTIGHQVILFVIAAVCAGSFFYCFKKKLPYSNSKVLSPDSFSIISCCWAVLHSSLLLVISSFNTMYLATGSGWLLLYPCWYCSLLPIISITWVYTVWQSPRLPHGQA